MRISFFLHHILLLRCRRRFICKFSYCRIALTDGVYVRVYDEFFLYSAKSIYLCIDQIYIDIRASANRTASFWVTWFCFHVNCVRVCTLEPRRSWRCAVVVVDSRLLSPCVCVCGSDFVSAYRMIDNGALLLWVTLTHAHYLAARYTRWWQHTTRRRQIWRNQAKQIADHSTPNQLVRVDCFFLYIGCCCVVCLLCCLRSFACVRFDFIVTNAWRAHSAFDTKNR